jgi:hypothetical protein
MSGTPVYRAINGPRQGGREALGALERFYVEF